MRAKTSFLRKCLRAAKNKALPLLPPLHAIDVLAASLDHLVYHGKWPLGASDKSYSRHLVHLRSSDALFDPLRQFVTDKEYVKLYVKGKVGDGYNIPTFLVTKSADEATTFRSGQEMVAKPTHLSQRVRLLGPGETLSRETAREWLSARYYPISREVNYRYLRPKIIFEKFLSEDGEFAKDYKFFCFRGMPKFLRVMTDRRTNLSGSFYDVDWNPLKLRFDYPQGPQIARPSRLEEMRRIAQELAAPFDSLRVDLYFCSGKIYVGELTNCTGGGREKLSPDAADECIGAFLRNPGLSAQEVFGGLQ